jgi:thiamine biosynthesis lipoprotein
MSVFVTAQADWVSEQQNKMGTRVEVQVWHADEARARELIAAGMAEFDRIESGMSTYIPQSEISRLNATAADGPVAVSEELFGIIDKSLGLSRLTHGAFDISYDSVGQHYDFRAGRKPSSQTIEQALPAIDYRLIAIDRAESTVHYRHPGVRINLGGIAKGYAIESVATLLRDAGVEQALVSAGGDTRLLGDRRGKPWVVGVRDPDDEQGIVTRLALEDEAISTSGDYERYFVADDIRYHHILNPDTGESVAGVRSATVIGPDAVMTDGLSTSVFVLGDVAGLALIESLPGYETIIIDDEHRVRFSAGLAAR